MQTRVRPDDRRRSADHLGPTCASSIRRGDRYYARTPEDLEEIPVHSSERLPNREDVTTFLDQWALSVYEGLIRWLRGATGGIDPRDVLLEILFGRKYRDPLEERGVFDRLRGLADLEISFPFQEVPEAQGRNGNQMGWMTDEVERKLV